MEPVTTDPIIENGNIIEQKPYYIAHSNVETLALLDKENKGTNWLQWRTRWVPIRTLSLIPMKIKITMNDVVPLYRKISPKVKELKALKIPEKDIAAMLKISIKTIKKACSI